MYNKQMKERILSLIQEKPKHFSQIIKRDNELVEEITANSGISSDRLLDHIYSYITGESNVCKNGNIKEVSSIKEGYKFCGRANKCMCAKESVSRSVAETKKQFSDETNHQINTKRKRTNIEKYGVDNTGQTSRAKENHKRFYEDTKKVDDVVAKTIATKIEKYGDAKYNNREKAKSTCLEKYGVDNTYLITENNSNKKLSLLKDIESLKALYHKKSIIEIAEYCNVHIQTVYKWLNYHGLRKPFVSSGEQELYNFLVNDLGVQDSEIIRNTRKVISKELDFYLPEYNLAIEFNGIYWHHEDVDHISKLYHYEKFKECENKGIQLLNILSVDWDNSKDKIKRIISHRLRKTKRKRIFARKCTVKYVSIQETRDILDCTHIQGYTTAQLALGLYYNEELVAVMTFSLPRTGIGKHRENCYELVRYTTKYDIPGGASRLLKHFLNDYKCDIISYSDNSWSTGDMYTKLGFELEQEHKPSYWYYRPRDTKLMHRYNFTKYKLVEQGFDKNKTERQITKEMGLLRYWDCGKRVWILKR